MIETLHPQPRKGFVDENGYDRPPCRFCKHKNKMSIEVPCDNCISIMDFATHKPNHETTFSSFEPNEEKTVTEEAE